MSARTKDSKVRFFDGKAPGTADDGKIKKDPHPHNQNWGRTGLLLVEGGTIILRLLLEEKVKQTTQGNLATYLKLPANYQTLFDLYQGKVISPVQWSDLYPNKNPQSVSVLEFDITLLYILVLHTCQFKGDILMDIQKIEKRRDNLYDSAKDSKLTDVKFEQEYEAVGTVLSGLIVSRELGREVDSRIKNMIKSLKSISITKEEILTYLDIVKRWYLSDIDVRKGVKELKPLLKNGQGDSKRAKDILAKLKMLAEDENNQLSDMKEIKEDLEKLASDLEGIKKKKTKLKTVLNILSILTPRFSQPFNIESLGVSIPSLHRWVDNGVQFVLGFYCQGQLHVYTKASKLVLEVKIKIVLGDERYPEGEVALIKAINTSKFKEQLITDLNLTGIATLSFTNKSFLVVPHESSDHCYRKLMESVKHPVWQDAVSNIFQTEQVKSHLSKGGCLCVSLGGDPTVMIDIRCRGSDTVQNKQLEGTQRITPTPYSWDRNARHFVVEKFFLGKREGSQLEGPTCVTLELTLLKGGHIDASIDSKLGQQLNDDKLDLKTLLSKDGVSSIKCDAGKCSITISFGSLASVKTFHDKFRYSDVEIFVNSIFDLQKVKKVISSMKYTVHVDVVFCLPEVECKGLPEPAPPLAPRNFKVVDVTLTSVVLSWTRPVSDGGINITGYHIEKHDAADKKWYKVGVAEPEDTTYDVTNLLTSHEYYFRIRAENFAGSSSLVETSEPVLLSRSKGLKGTDLSPVHAHENKAKHTPRERERTFVKTKSTVKDNEQSPNPYLQKTPDDSTKHSARERERTYVKALQTIEDVDENLEIARQTTKELKLNSQVEPIKDNKTTQSPIEDKHTSVKVKGTIDVKETSGVQKQTINQPGNTLNSSSEKNISNETTNANEATNNKSNATVQADGTKSKISEPEKASISKSQNEITMSSKTEFKTIKYNGTLKRSVSAAESSITSGKKRRDGSLKREQTDCRDGSLKREKTRTRDGSLRREKTRWRDGSLKREVTAGRDGSLTRNVETRGRSAKTDDITTREATQRRNNREKDNAMKLSVGKSKRASVHDIMASSLNIAEKKLLLNRDLRFRDLSLKMDKNERPDKSKQKKETSNKSKNEKKDLVQKPNDEVNEVKTAVEQYSPNTDHEVDVPPEVGNDKPEVGNNPLDNISVEQSDWQESKENKNKKKSKKAKHKKTGKKSAKRNS